MLLFTVVVLVGVALGYVYMAEITALVEHIAHIVTTWTWFQDWIWKE